MKQFLSYVGSGPFQYAIADGLGYGPEYYRTIAEELRLRRDLLVDGLPSWGFGAAAAGHLLRHRRRRAATPRQWCRALPERAGVVAIPSRVFYDSDIDRYARFAFCKKPDVLAEALADCPDSERSDRMKIAAVQHDIVWEDGAATRAG